MNNNTVRTPAEWEPQDAVLMAWPHRLTDWNYMLDEVRECYGRIARAVAAHARLIIVAPDCSDAKNALGIDDRITYIDIETNDTWTRDYGALTTIDSSGHPVINDYKFNGWGLKFAANHDNLVTMRLWERGIWDGSYRNRLGFVLEGGSVDFDGADTVLTTSECLLSPNRNGDLSRDEIADILKHDFGVNNVLWINHGALEGDDTDSHVDTLARLAPGSTILYVGCDDETDSHYASLKAMEREILSFRRPDGMPFNTIALPLPDAIYDEDGCRLPATYANYLVVNDAVLLPVYRQPRKDTLAAQMLKIVYHDREIIPVDCRALIRQHGSLHCATMQFPSNTIAL